jgi:hypothetical protein
MEYKDFCFVNADAVPLDKLISDLVALRNEAVVAGFKNLITTIDKQPNKLQNYLYIKGTK